MEPPKNHEKDKKMTPFKRDEMLDSGHLRVARVLKLEGENTMKSIIFLIAILAAPTVFANQVPLVIKESHSGHVAPAYVRMEKCELYLDKVDITRSFGTGDDRVTLTEKRPVSLSREAMLSVSLAKLEAVAETDNRLCDGPSTSIHFYDGQVLFSTGGCGSPRKEREGPYSQRLRAILDTYCPTTHDFVRR